MSKQAVATAFDGAEQYARQARVQYEVAERLAVLIMQQSMPDFPRILEIGCGTGFLATALQRRGLNGAWTITDISTEMLRRCRESLGHLQNARYAVMDGEHPSFDDERFDLICSSLAFQWFEDLPAAIERLAKRLNPGGVLCFTTMAAGSFAEWRSAYNADVPDYPSAAELARLGLDVSAYEIETRFETAIAFLRHLRGIGADVLPGKKLSLAPGAMRKAMRQFEREGAIARYRIASCTYIHSHEQAA